MKGKTKKKSCVEKRYRYGNVTKLDFRINKRRRSLWKEERSFLEPYCEFLLGGKTFRILRASRTGKQELNWKQVEWLVAYKEVEEAEWELRWFTERVSSGIIKKIVLDRIKEEDIEMKARK